MFFGAGTTGLSGQLFSTMVFGHTGCAFMIMSYRTVMATVSST